MSKLTYIYMGTPQIARTILEDLSQKIGKPKLVITQPSREAGRGLKPKPSEVQTWAEENGQEFLATETLNTPEILNRLRALEPDLIIVVAFGQLLKDEVLNLPKKYCLNVHASLLPKYRGAAPIQRAIFNGEKKTGITIQKMVQKLDAGDIVLQKELPIAANDTSQSLLDKLAGMGAQALVECFELIEKGKENLIPQNEKEVTWAAKLEKTEAPIDWTKTAVEVDQKIRAFIPWPVAEAYLEKEKLRLYKAKPLPNSPLKSGEIETDHKSYLRVGCGGKTALDLLEVQAENRKRMPIENYLQGYRGHFPFKAFQTNLGER